MPIPVILVPPPDFSTFLRSCALLSVCLYIRLTRKGPCMESFTMGTRLHAGGGGGRLVVGQFGDYHFVVLGF